MNKQSIKKNPQAALSAYVNEVSRRSFLKAALGLGASCALAPAALSLSGCNSQKAQSSNSSAMRTFTDSVAREVSLHSEIKRVVPSGPYAQVILCTLCPDKLIGLSSSFSKQQSKFFSDELTSLPVLGRYYGKNADMNYENVISMYPDCIVDAGEEGEDMTESMDNLQSQTGIPCVFIDATFANIAKAYRMMGDLLGEETRAEELATYIDKVVAFADEHRTEVEARNISLMYSTGAYGYQVKEAGSVHSQAIEYIGLNNVATLSDANATEVSPEQVMNWQPDVLLLSKEMGFFDQIYEDKTWSTVNAVINKRVYEVPYEPYEWLDKPPSVQTVLGMQWLGNLICPDIYNFDISDCAREFFELFWGYSLSDSELADLLGNSSYLVS